MANDATVTVEVAKFSTKKQQKLLSLLNNPRTQAEINQITGNAINKFVPMKSGALRASMEVTPTTISWGNGLAYARYQYGGEVYGPNLPIVRKGTIVGWYSIKGMKKHPTGRELGIPGEWMGWRFGYTTPDTKHHWDKLYTYQPKRKANLEITRYLKRLCKQKGLRT